MDLFEFEKAVGLPRTVIAFYAELLPPTKKDARWRDYDESHVNRLKKIIILRKLGIPMEELSELFDGKLSLQDALERRAEAYKNELSPPLGAKQLCTALLGAGVTVDSMDADVYTDALRDAEANGLTFEDISRDRMGTSKASRTRWKLLFFETFDKKERKDLLLSLLEQSVILLIIGFIDVFRNDLPLWDVLFLPTGGLIIFGAFYLLSLFGRKHPKGAMHILSVICWIAVTAIVLLFLFIIVLLLNSVLHFWY